MDQATFNQLKSLLEKISDMPEEQVEAWINISQKRIYQKGEYFSIPENPSTRLGYVARGLLRFYMLDRKGRECTFGFGGEDTFVSSYGAVIFNQQHIKYIQAIEKTEIYSCERTEFIKLWESNEAWKVFLQKATEMDCLRIRKRESDFLMFDAKTRYQIFLEDFPQFRNRIKQEYIASYLGISPETLSRIKSGKMEKQ